MFLNLLQASVEGQSQFLSNLTTSEAFLMVIAVGIAGMLVQLRLRSVVSKYSQVPMPTGITGAEIAEKMLRYNGVNDVVVTHTGGYLTDHYNPATKTVNLSDEVYHGRSITAAAIACHECGHALQHAKGYAPLKMRSALVPLVQFSSTAATWIIITGLIMTASSGSQTLCWIGIGLMCMSALFSIITLPVEYNASDRALKWLESSGLLFGEELEGAKISLRWAARTYLVAALSAIASILYYVALINGRNRD
ncbi:MAG: zinc metallopeptidase [Alistipes sp.]|nr:zinc metallopeptidase [Alistipes sp.]